MFDPIEMEFLKSALILLVAGMGMTFLFLLIQIFCTSLNSRIAAHFAHLLPDPEPAKPAKAKTTAVVSDDDDALVAAIAASIHHSR